MSRPAPAYEDVGYYGKKGRWRYKRKLAVWNKTGGVCAYCGIDLEFMFFHVDHIRARACGGGDEPDNLTAACERCNCQKGEH